MFALYKNDFQKFIEYNIKDVELIDRLEESLGLITLSMTMAYRGGVNYRDVLGTTKIWDNIIYRMLNKNKVVCPPKEEKSKSSFVGGYVKEDIYKTFPKARKKFLSAIVEYNGPIKAPIKKDQEIGLLKISYKGDLIDEYPVYAVEKVKRVNIFSRIIQSVNYLIWGDV